MKEHLLKDEQILWEGKPKSGIVFRAGDIILIPLSLFFWVFPVLVFIPALLSEDTSFAMVTVFLPFIIAAIYVTFGRFFFDAYVRRNTHYAITENRILIHQKLFKTKLEAIPLKNLQKIILSRSSKGRGTITLGQSDLLDTFFEGMYWPNLKHAPKLELIEDAKNVYNIIHKVTKNLTPKAASAPRQTSF
ncbi:MAG TPA: PH domain-containing protein [Patescibacteria group bacterium]|nr:PH domain-containing protein [Patescibacteria group bacterium]